MNRIVPALLSVMLMLPLSACHTAPEAPVYEQPADGEKLTDDVQVNMEISIVANEFAYNFMHLIRYATWRGVKWKVTSVEPQYPRLLLSLGGVYNG